MKQTNGQNQPIRNFLNAMNKRQASGFAYTLSAVLPALLSLLFLIIISVFGLTGNEGYQNKDWYLYASYLITPVAFLLLALLFYKKTDAKLSESFRLGKGKYYLIALLLQFGLFSLSELNGLFLKGLHSLFGYQSDPIVLPNVMGFGIVGVIITVALLPAIFEELFFRGILLRGLKDYGEAFAVLVCGGLFALYHQNPAQTAYQFCCGAAFALVAVKAGGILPTVLSHFINNTVIIVLYRVGIAEFSTGFKIPFLICSALALLGSVAYLIFFDKRETSENKPKKSEFFLYASAGIFVFALSWITTFISGI